MREFLKRIPAQIASTYTIMLIVFTIISLKKDITIIPVTRLLELFILAVIGGIWMEFAFGQCVFKKLSDMKRICIFIVPFAVVTFILAVLFQWITKLDMLDTYVMFIGIFVGCWAVSVILFEMEHRMRGRQYTQKLREYQAKEKNHV